MPASTQNKASTQQKTRPKAPPMRKENQPKAEEIIRKWETTAAVSIADLAADFAKTHEVHPAHARRRILFYVDHMNARTIRDADGTRKIILEDARSIMRGGW